MDYRIDKDALLGTLSAWDGFLSKKVHLIACGGTVLTFLGVKSSTKDVDMLVPNEAEYNYLIKVLKDLGYKQTTGQSGSLPEGDGWVKEGGFIFDLFRGKRVHTTELLESPLLPTNNTLIKELSHIYLGALNYYDLIISKLFRGTEVDRDDCLSLIKSKRSEIDMMRLKERYRQTASYDVSEDKLLKKLEHFLTVLKKEGLLDEK